MQQRLHLAFASAWQSDFHKICVDIFTVTFATFIENGPYSFYESLNWCFAAEHGAVIDILQFYPIISSTSGESLYTVLH